MSGEKNSWTCSASIVATWKREERLQKDEYFDRERCRVAKSERGQSVEGDQMTPVKAKKL